MPMELYLYNYENSENINNIFSWNSEAPQWWITGFNPDYINNVDVTKYPPNNLPPYPKKSK